MILHQTKLRELVIDGWRLGFQKLKRDLAVHSLMMLILLLICSTQAAVGQISFIMDIWNDRTAELIWRLLHTGLL